MKLRKKRNLEIIIIIEQRKQKQQQYWHRFYLFLVFFGSIFILPSTQYMIWPIIINFVFSLEFINRIYHHLFNHLLWWSITHTHIYTAGQLLRLTYKDLMTNQPYTTLYPVLLDSLCSSVIWKQNTESIVFFFSSRF